MSISNLTFPYAQQYVVSTDDIDAIKLRSKESAPLTHEDLDDNFANLTNKINELLGSAVLSDSNGNVGIGTDNPDDKLHVNGDIVIGPSDFVVGDSVYSYIRPKYAGAAIKMGANNNTWDRNLHFGHHGNDGSFGNKVTILMASGNVGIGTTSPATNLHCEDASNIAILRLSTESTTAYSQVKGGGTTGSFTVEADPTNSFDGTVIALRVDGTDKMRIDSDGNVGIGTTSPTANLHVSQSADSSFTGRTEFARWELKENLNVQFDGFGDSHSSRPGWFQIGAWNNDTGIAIVSDAVANIENGLSTNGIFIKKNHAPSII